MACAPPLRAQPSDRHSSSFKCPSADDSRVRRALEVLHAESAIIDPLLLARAEGKEDGERTTLLDQAFTLVRGCAPGTAVELGTSFGISTIYMAAAVRERGTRPVVTTERHAGRVAKARQFIDEAGLLDVVDLRVGASSTSMSLRIRRPNGPLSNSGAAFPWNDVPRNLLHDRDQIFGPTFHANVETLGIKDVPSTPHAPWQRAYVERVIGSIRRECLDHVIVLNEASPVAR